jgi:hypothetical protein
MVPVVLKQFTAAGGTDTVDCSDTAVNDGATYELV